MVNFAEPLHFSTVSEFKKHRASTAKKSKRAMSIVTFNTLGSDYTVPKNDHKYHIRYASKLGRGVHYKHPSQSYMSKIVTRAKSSVDPRKYTPQVNWAKTSKERPNLALPREEKVTMTEQTIRDKKKIPGPSFYKKTDQKPKIHGFYGNSESKVTIFESINFSKKHIPGPSKYESRGKSMSQILKDKARNYLYVDKSDGDGPLTKIKKTDAPAPTSYAVAEALDKSAFQKRSYQQVFDK